MKLEGLVNHDVCCSEACCVRRGSRTGGCGHARERQQLRLEVERFHVMSFEVWPQMWTTDMNVGDGHWKRGSKTL